MLGKRGTKLKVAVPMALFASLAVALLGATFGYRYLIGPAETDFRAAYEADEQGDKEKAAQLFLRCAEAGHCGCLDKAAERYARGEGVKQDFAAALEWYHKAYDGGSQCLLTSARAANALGFMYRSGQGAPADPREAGAWYDRARTLVDKDIPEDPLFKENIQEAASALKVLRAAVYGGQAALLEDAGRLDEAILLYREARDLDPQIKDYREALERLDAQ